MKRLGVLTKKILLSLCILGLVYSSTNIILWVIDVNKNKQQIDTLPKYSPDKNSNFLNDLKNINPDTRGWIKVDGTNVNYPFVQAKDNIFYLSHSFDGSRNMAGWIFLDYRIDLAYPNKNTIIYGHDRKDNTMFGALDNIFKNEWQENKNSNKIKLYTEKGITEWQVFSSYHIETTNDYLHTSFANDDEYGDFLRLIKNRSALQYETGATVKDRIITLSTCYSRSKKTVIHAKLVN